jgi:hypothetical protein
MRLATSRFDDETRVLVEALDAEHWKTLRDITYGPYTVPAGFRTDFASVPRVAVWLIPRFGRFTLAAILHDYLLTLVRAGSLASVEADRVFREALAGLDTPPVRQWLMWTGVRWGAAASPYRRAGWWRTAPQVLGMTVAVLSTVVIPVAVVAVALGLAVYSLFEAAATGGRRRGNLTT